MSHGSVKERLGCGYWGGLDCMSKFWKPGSLGPLSDVDRSYLNENEWVPTIVNGKLPIIDKSLKILFLLENYQVVVISSETGSGKTTQIPQILVDHGWAQGDRYLSHIFNGRCVAISLPRRIAATSVAKRVAQERSVVLGKEVGYAVRFDECWSPEQTRIKYVTDGMLFREAMIDRIFHNLIISSFK